MINSVRPHLHLFQLKLFIVIACTLTSVAAVYYRSFRVPEGAQQIQVLQATFMISIYDAANAVEAHMILQLLQQSGISGQIGGEYLQGAMGELPVTGNVHVNVLPQDVGEAKKIIEEWESVQPAEAPEAAQRPPETGGQKATYFVAGAVLAAIALFLLFRFPGSSEGFDYDGDGKLDTNYYWQGSLISKVEHDRNRDGDVDLRLIYGLDGVIKATEADNDFNGSFENATQYIDGNPDVERIDSSGDGTRDIHNDYQNGVLTESQLYDPFTNNRKKINHYNAFGKLVESEFDSDGNGSFDVKITYDAFEEPITN